ncbi:hypothetical protein KP509_11G041200 [Ceratopteris richardii]|uniref:Bidirectional sugar transporter SWEET n=1 Tax=Ceratopteris richardii TaxID=49495 RepID=A0A8T2TTR1_CERRI|nr:hypothetical protein KP509_11G041200 [Ceratopteris richardii]
MALNHAAILARTIIGIIGNVISFALFLSPVPTFVKVIKWRSTREFSGVPYVVMLLNSTLWVFYGIPAAVSNNILVSTTNGIGTVLEIVYIIIFLIFSDYRERRKIVLLLSAVPIIFTAVVLCNMLFVDTLPRRAEIVGSLCIVAGIGMYAAPLTIMGKVIRAKSVKYMPFALSFTYFINGLFWSTYACMGIDIFLLIANGAGALLGACQLVLYATYYHGVHPEDQEKTRQDGHELEKVTTVTEANQEIHISKTTK